MSNPSRPPNIIYIMMDDMGFGDVEGYGRTLMRTPHMKRVMDEGVRFDRMYSAPTCSPARIQVLTGCYAQRAGVPRVLFPDDVIGIRADTPTVAAHLRAQGYATMAAGKWHVGCRDEHLPTRHGFDRYFGLLYSNDMAPLALYQDDRPSDEPVVQAALTRRYTEESLAFIEANRHRPFFLHLAHTMPHVPLAAEPDFLGRSACGLYGDTIECIDHYLGVLLDRLQALGLDDDTVVIVTSDNGPWYEGNTAGNRGRKFDVFEGGIRVPFIARWPRGIPAGVHSAEPAHLMDLLPTFVGWAGGTPPAGIDGCDIGHLFQGQGTSPHDYLFLYHVNELKAVIKGRWKLHLQAQRGEYFNAREFPQLFDLVDDPDESYNLASRHPQLVAELSAAIADCDARLRPCYVDTPRPGR